MNISNWLQSEYTNARLGDTGKLEKGRFTSFLKFRNCLGEMCLCALGLFVSILSFYWASPGSYFQLSLDTA